MFNPKIAIKILLVGLLIATISIFAYQLGFGKHGVPLFCKNITSDITEYQKFISYCKGRIPEGDSILLLQDFRAGFTNYYLMPRKVYLTPKDIGNNPQKLKEWMRQKGVRWVIDYNTVGSNFDPQTAKLEQVEK